jgi:hypothetical protein
MLKLYDWPSALTLKQQGLDDCKHIVCLKDPVVSACRCGVYLRVKIGGLIVIVVQVLRVLQYQWEGVVVLVRRDRGFSYSW